jgi:hypothetical protein
MKSPTATELLQAAAAGVAVDISDGATADEWRDISVRLAETMAQWFRDTNRHLNEQSFAGELARRDQAAKKSTAQRIGSRPDQKQRRAFLEWARVRITEGCRPRNVIELQELPGFVPAWSARDEGTLKEWSKEVGFVFRGGRPKKK